jgi:hypothetical protein
MGCELVISDPQGGLQPQPTTLALGHFCFRLPALLGAESARVSQCATSGGAYSRFQPK